MGVLDTPKMSRFRAHFDPLKMGHLSYLVDQGGIPRGQKRSQNGSISAIMDKSRIPYTRARVQ